MLPSICEKSGRRIFFVSSISDDLTKVSAVKIDSFYDVYNKGREPVSIKSGECLGDVYFEGPNPDGCHFETYLISSSNLQSFLYNLYLKCVLVWLIPFLFLEQTALSPSSLEVYFTI